MISSHGITIYYYCSKRKKRRETAIIRINKLLPRLKQKLISDIKRMKFPFPCFISQDQKKIKRKVSEQTTNPHLFRKSEVKTALNYLRQLR